MSLPILKTELANLTTRIDELSANMQRRLRKCAPFRYDPAGEPQWRLRAVALFGNSLIRLSLSQTLSGWQLIENRAILLRDEGSLQTYWLDGRRPAPVAGDA